MHSFLIAIITNFLLRPIAGASLVKQVDDGAISSILAPRPVVKKPINLETEFGASTPSPDTGTLQRKASGTSSQGSFGFEMLEGNFPYVNTPTPSSIGYDFLDDLSINSMFLDCKTDLLISRLKKAHQEPIQLINFDGLLKYFVDNPRITCFSDEHHMELAMRIAADADNLVEVWERLKLFVETNTPEQVDKNIFRVYALLKNYLVKTEHQLSKLFKNEVYDDQLSVESHADRVRGDTSTICSEEERSEVEDEDEKEGLNDDSSQVGDNEIVLNEDVSSEPDSEEDEESEEDHGDEESVDHESEGFEPRSPPSSSASSLEQLQKIQEGLIHMEKIRFNTKSFMLPSGIHKFYKSPFYFGIKFEPTQPTISEAINTDETLIEEVD